jgi:hypothetical protein
MTIRAAASEMLRSRRLSLPKASTDSTVTLRHGIAIDRPRRSFQPADDAARPLNINSIEFAAGTELATGALSAQALDDGSNRSDY